MQKWIVTIYYTANGMEQTPSVIEVSGPEHSIAIATAGGALAISVDEYGRRHSMNIGFRITKVSAEAIKQQPVVLS